MPNPWERNWNVQSDVPQQAPEAPKPWERNWNSQPAPMAAESQASGPLAQAQGFAHGAGEMLNPAAIPHGIEVLGRAAAKLTGGPGITNIPTVGDAFREAEKEAKLPKGDLDQVAAGIRTAVGLAQDILAGQPPSSDEIGNRYQQELQSQKDYNKNYIAPEGEKAGEITTGIISLAGAAKDILVATGMAKKLGGAAENLAVTSLKPTKAEIKALNAQGKTNTVGRALLDENVPGFGRSWSGMLEKVSDKYDELGAKIGQFSKDADNLVKEGKAQGIPVKSIVQDVENGIIPQLIQDGKSDVANNLRNWVETNIVGAADENGMLGYSQAQRLKKTINETKSKFGSIGIKDTPSMDAYRDLYRVVNAQHEANLETALQGTGKTVEDFIKTKQDFAPIAEAKDILENTVARKGANRMFSLTDYAVGAPATVGGLMHAGPSGALTGAAAAVANKIAREHGGQFAASVLNFISKSQDLDVLRKAANIIGEGTGIANTAMNLGEK